MNDLISRQAAVAMSEKIVDEVEYLTVDPDEKKVWAKALIDSILPAEDSDDNNISIERLWPINTGIIPNGGIGMDWSGVPGLGQLELFWGDDGKLYADTKGMGKDFLRGVLSKLVEEIVIYA